MTLLGLTEQHCSAVIEIGANHPGEVADAYCDGRRIDGRSDQCGRRAP
jgi:hypothetical protein